MPTPESEKGVAVWQTPHGEVKLSASLIRRYFCPTATDQEAMVFLALCRYQGLNPWLRDAYLIKYGTSMPATMVVGKDTFTKRAARHPSMDGFEAGIIVQFEADPMERREGSLVLEGENIIGGWARVHRKDRVHPIYAEVSFEEYAGKTKDGALTRSWKQIPATMIRKVALVQALREAFPDELSGLYDAAEMKIEPSELPEMPLKATNGNEEEQLPEWEVPVGAPVDDFINDAEVEALKKLARKAKHEDSVVAQWLMLKYKATSATAIKASDYSAICQRLANSMPLTAELVADDARE